ncbi:histidine kinase [Pedobacter sp. MC2016-05]|uniref:sensor histidine kinase n=1 Tax=Pedobacter sp. MC2016-05 TaxID=2994474 RepID=UPI0022469DA3|nr:histidine kinase [Pedobacter sp. MC2016-05]MCX2474379.1 histidine kinase [Pedobacter sp. MC2016-05]
MKKIIFILFNLIIGVCTANAQEGIDFSRQYSAGRKLLICVDSSARNIYYDNKFPNQPNTSFSYLPEVNKVSIQIYFKKTDNIDQYRYTILADNKPILVNQSFDKSQLKDYDAGDQEIFSFTRLGIFSVKGKVITTLLYSIEKPLDVYKSVFYGKVIPKAEMKFFSKRVEFEHGSGYETNIKERTNFIFGKKDLGLTVIKNKSDEDYLYYTSISDKQTNKIVFSSNAWEYGHFIEGEGEFSPYVKINKDVFKKSGEYEIIIQPLIKWNLPMKEKEKFITKHKISINFEEEKFFSTKQLITSGLLFPLIAGAITGGLAVYFKNQQIKKKVAAEAKQKEIAQLQLNSVRSQLNPHFLFNALAGIQNLMNKNEIDNANRYLSKFARLTRNVLDSKELISLIEEKKLLDDYLQMEQLRFGFRYKINASADLDTENIEIPAMLLQPFVENTVKHGIAEKGNDGEIAISFEKQVSNLVLKITDNGSGFDTAQTYDGLGLALSKNRISLLNTVYKDTPFILNIQSDTNGTMITITLSQWL